MPRLDRLWADYHGLADLSRRTRLIKVVPLDGPPPERYLVTYRCKGLVWMQGSPAPSISTFHRLNIYLHRDYPRRPPRLIWLSDIFHPNILPPERNGGICIGSWSPAESLDRLVIRIGEMVQYKNYNVDLSDVLNKEAAVWAAANQGHLPVDARPLDEELGD